MTKEEREKAIAVLNTYDMSEDTEFKFAVAKSIEALKQEPILDEIRAEIEDMDTLVTKFEVLDIIEKYESESEG